VLIIGDFPNDQQWDFFGLIKHLGRSLDTIEEFDY
jgi:hypothetical protein